MKKRSEHYVNNAEFSKAVCDYVEEVNRAEEQNQEIPEVTDYIASCFMKIAEKLSRKDNFGNYSFREEMVMDGVENCLKAIRNYNIEAATRSGKPNAFSYFTTITWYAFIRRITKEKKQQDIKMKYMASAPLDHYISYNINNPDQVTSAANYVDTLRSRIDQVKDHDRAIKEFAKEEEKRDKKQQELDKENSDE